MSSNWTSLLLQNLNGLSLGLEREIPNIFCISKEHRDNYECHQILLTDQNEHIRDINGNRDAMHGAVDDVLDNIHIIGESIHDHSIRSHIKEQIDWCIQNAFQHIVVHIFECLINESTHDEFLSDLAKSLEENNRNNFVNVCPKLSWIVLFFLVLSPLTNHVI